MMSDELPYRTPESSVPTRRPWRLRTWFMVGFVLTFVCIVVLVNHHVHMSKGLVPCKLWEFYLYEFVSFIQSARDDLGPASGRGSRALYVLVMHVAASCVGGLVALGVGALRRRFKDTN